MEFAGLLWRIRVICAVSFHGLVHVCQSKYIYIYISFNILCSLWLPCSFAVCNIVSKSQWNFCVAFYKSYWLWTVLLLSILSKWHSFLFFKLQLHRLCLTVSSSTCFFASYMKKKEIVVAFLSSALLIEEKIKSIL